MRTRRSKRADADTASGGPAHGAPAPALARRRRVLIAVVVGALVTGGAGFGLSTVVRSPAQAAAEAGAPERDVLTADVEHRVLRSSLVVRGEVAAERTFTVSAAVNAAEGAEPLVTKAPLRTGDQVRAGSVLVEVSGRPVFALPGSLPAYRDLKPTSRGKDVTQLREALAGRGFPSVADPAGEFGAATQAALEAFYRSLGYDPRPVAEDGADRVEAARTAVTDAERALQDVQAADPREPKAVVRGEEDLGRARDALAEARLQAGAMLPASEVVFLDRFPARVESVAAQVGDRAPGDVMTISSGSLGIRGALTPSQRNAVAAGQKVRILAEATGDEFDGTTGSVTDPDGSQQRAQGDGATEDGAGDTGDGAMAVLNVTPDTKLDAALVGQEVRLTIEIRASRGKVLVVPFSAVSSAADGSTVVTVLAPNGERRQVRVRPGLEGDGSVQVTPSPKDALAPGDRVIVGKAPGSEDATR
ncbi:MULTISPECIES: peptidoglycan-binding protein [Streptomyces]|uniref:peptidoglycan-binding protein n=1 Tax=Streptomyces TaxID=1883 RepID=UPI0023E79708|nr:MULTISPECIES: peptidoglycan-binding protein [Streptomyces]